MMLSCFLIVVTWSVVYAQEMFMFDNITTPNMPMPAQTKPAGLPEVQWNVLHIDLVNRENLCTRQIAFCANNCGGPDEAPKNFCNATSLAWGCGCSKKKADITTYSWPVVLAECSGKAQECRSICNKDIKNLATCVTACNTYYQCGTNKAPPSYLETNDPSSKPSYDGPPSPSKNNSNKELGIDEYGIADFSRGSRNLSTCSFYLFVAVHFMYMMVF